MMFSKKKRYIIVCLVFVIILSFASATGAKEQLEMSPQTFNKLVDTIQKKYPDAVVFDPVTPEELALLLKEQGQSLQNDKLTRDSVEIFAPAPPITYLNIELVYSDSTDWQDVSNYLTTPEPVSGYTEIVTKVIGHGQVWRWLDDEFITLNHPDYLQAQLPIDLNGDNIVDGYWHVVGFDSDEKIPNGGEFKFQGRSYNYPWNTEVDVLNITHQ